MRLLKGLSSAALVLAGLLAAGITYLFTADLGGQRGLIESAISNSVGRKLSIEGEFHLRLGSTIRLSAGRIRLANASWGTAPDMLDVDQLALQVDLLSLFSKPIRIRLLSIGPVKLHLERNKQNQANWIFARFRPVKIVPVFLGRADVRHVDVTLQDPEFQQPMTIQLNNAQIAEDQQTLLNLSINLQF